MGNEWRLLASEDDSTAYAVKNRGPCRTGRPSARMHGTTVRVGRSLSYRRAARACVNLAKNNIVLVEDNRR